jgi:hypothetical protein
MGVAFTELDVPASAFNQKTLLALVPTPAGPVCEKAELVKMRAKNAITGPFIRGLKLQKIMKELIATIRT